DLVDGDVGPALDGGLRELPEHDELGEGRDAPHAPIVGITERGYELRRELERETTVAAHVVVRARVLLAGIADEHRPRDELERATARSVPEAALPDVRHREPGVHLRKWRIGGTDVAAVVGHRDGAALPYRDRTHRSRA